ncbi:MAG: hypothetical protein MJ066_04705, partial [Clostridia bacterium]|nr:hypothetical protein [Clostridia bacterium]
VHMLTGPAFNALLKTLEEPPKHAVFILATTEVHKIPATILSRCMRFDFRLVATEKIAELIGKIYDEQGKKYEKEAIFAIAKAGEGSVRDALSIADTAISYSDKELTYEDVMEILGSSNSDLILTFAEYMLNGNTGKVLETINSLSKLGKSMGVLIKDVTSVLRDLIIAKTCENANSILSLPQTKFDRVKEIANKATEEKILRSMEILSLAESSLKYSTHPRVVFETAAIKASRPDTDYSIDALNLRIKALEEKINNGIKVSPVKEEIVVEKPVNNENPVEKSQNKVSVEGMDGEVLKGKMLYNLREQGNLMIQNVMDGVKVEIKGKNVCLIPSDESDAQILKRSENIEKLNASLQGFNYGELIVEDRFNKGAENEMEDATENIKKIFGEDIVIIKS